MATRDWEDAMFRELDSMSDVDQIVACGEWITYMTQELLTKLAQRRRHVVNNVLARPDWDATRLAETIGSRRGTIMRLAEEGRRDDRLQAAA